MIEKSSVIVEYSNITIDKGSIAVDDRLIEE